jgi:hypothetical protein
MLTEFWLENEGKTRRSPGRTESRCVGVVRGKVQWRAHVNAIMNLLIM